MRILYGALSLLSYQFVNSRAGKEVVTRIVGFLQVEPPYFSVYRRNLDLGAPLAQLNDTTITTLSHARLEHGASRYWQVGLKSVTLGSRGGWYKNGTRLLVLY